MKNENLFDVSKKTVFITGASSGIGQSAATCLAKNVLKLLELQEEKINLSIGVTIVKVILHIIQPMFLKEKILKI